MLTVFAMGQMPLSPRRGAAGFAEERRSNAIQPRCVASEQSTDGPAERALRFFQVLAGTDPATWLAATRPTPVPPEERARALGVLPDQGELTPTPAERAKLAALRRILAYHGRAQVFETKLIDLPQAAIGLHGRAVILISRPALRLASAPELQALVAHEIGHEYFWHEFEQSSAQSDKQARQELELKCDGIAVVTLVALGLEPGHLTAGLRRMWRFNQALGATANADLYPPMRDRERFVAAVRNMASAQALPLKLAREPARAASLPVGEQDSPTDLGEQRGHGIRNYAGAWASVGRNRAEELINRRVSAPACSRPCIQPSHARERRSQAAPGRGE
jgi:hypothetical protein